MFRFFSAKKKERQDAGWWNVIFSHQTQLTWVRFPILIELVKTFSAKHKFKISIMIMHSTAMARGWIVSSCSTKVPLRWRQRFHLIIICHGRYGDGEAMKEEVPNWYGYIKRFCRFSRYHKCLHIFSDTQNFSLVSPTRCLKTFLSEHSRFNCETFASRIEVFCFFRGLFSLFFGWTRQGMERG